MFRTPMRSSFYDLFIVKLLNSETSNSKKSPRRFRRVIFFRSADFCIVFSSILSSERVSAA